MLLAFLWPLIKGLQWMVVNCNDEDEAGDVADDKYQDSLFTRTILAHTNFGK